MLITLRDVSYFIDRGLLLDDINFTVSPQDRIAIVGRNGSGKSTLLKILANDDLSPSSGEYDRHEKVSVLLVKQEFPSNNNITPINFLKENDKELQALKAQEESVSAEMIGELYENIFHIEEERYERLAPKVLHGLGLSAKEQTSPMKNLSGGLRMRIALAAGLIQQPDVLLLDEPTNHLDLPSIFWLVEFLKNYPKAVVLISHDPMFLREVPTKTAHLQQAKLTMYNGNFDTFQKEYQLKQEQAKEVNANMDKRHQITQAFVDAKKAHPKWAKIARTRERLMEKDNENRPVVINEEPITIVDFPSSSEVNGPLLELQNVSVGYDKQKALLTAINLSVEPNARIGILGRNGQGKSTLAKLITGNLEPTSGLMITNQRLRIGYFSQDLEDTLDNTKTVYQQLASVLSNPTDSDIREYLAKFGFKQDFVHASIKNLSGGEKTRLLFALIAAKRPNLIVMDEPTNHLDLETRQSLIEAIRRFNGALILVSHDWDLLNQATHTHWLVFNGKVESYTKGLEAYKEAAIKRTMQADKPTASSSKPTSAKLFDKPASRDKGKETVGKKLNQHTQKRRHNKKHI